MSKEEYQAQVDAEAEHDAWEAEQRAQLEDEWQSGLIGRVECIRRLTELRDELPSPDGISNCRKALFLVALDEVIFYLTYTSPPANRLPDIHHANNPQPEREE